MLRRQCESAKTTSERSRIDVVVLVEPLANLTETQVQNALRPNPQSRIFHFFSVRFDEVKTNLCVTEARGQL